MFSASPAAGVLDLGGLAARDPEALAAIRDALPGELVPIVAVLTELGQPLLVAALATATYWFGVRRGLVSSRDDAARLLALGFGGLALVVALKALFALPRPPTELHAVHADGYAFPSGHTTSATVGYGAAAALLDRGRRRVRFGVAGALVAAVAASRVLLGVHYPADVVAGVVLGGAYLAVGLAVSRDRPARAFGLAAATGVVAGLLAWPTLDAATAAGGTLGVAAAWVLVRRRAEATPGTSAGVRGAPTAGVPSAPAAGVVLCVAAALAALVQVAAPPPAVALPVTGALAACAAAFPATPWLSG